MMRKTGKANRNRWSKKGRAVATHKPIEEELQQQPLETAAAASVTTDAVSEARANARYDAAAAVRSMNRSFPQRTPQPPPGYHPEAEGTATAASASASAAAAQEARQGRVQKMREQPELEEEIEELPHDDALGWPEGREPTLAELMAEQQKLIDIDLAAAAAQPDSDRDVDALRREVDAARLHADIAGLETRLEQLEQRQRLERSVDALETLQALDQLSRKGTAEPELEPEPEDLAAAEAERRLRERHAAERMAVGGQQQAAGTTRTKVCDGQSLTLSSSYIPQFDGHYQCVGQANGKPHWENRSSGMHLYFGPKGMWLLRSQFTPQNPTASAFCDAAVADLYMDSNNPFQWSTGFNNWKMQMLCIEPGPPGEEAVGSGPSDGQQVGSVPDALILVDTLVQCGKFDGIYELVSGSQANGKPHWCCDDGSASKLHLYWGPQALWLLRSRFEPDQKACSAYCSCDDDSTSDVHPAGSKLWHWMWNGTWEPQQLTIEPGFRGGSSATTAVGGAPSSRLHQATDATDTLAEREREEARWSLSEECEPPREVGPWDVKAANVAAAARKKGADNSFGIATADLSIGNADKPIIEQLAEYLFNLFDDDYQLGEECQVLAAFEERACLAFDTPIEDGFTFEQEALHREFCGLFDSMANGFLEARGVEEQELGEALQAAIAEREGKPCEGNSDGTYTTRHLAQ